MSHSSDDEPDDDVQPDAPGGPAEVVLDDFFPHLVNMVTQRIAADFQAKARRHGVTIEKWRVLSALLAHGPQAISALSRKTSIELSTLSKLLRRMEAENFVSRARSSADGRLVTIGLTRRGRAVATAVLPLARRYEEIALRTFDPQAAARLKAELRTIYRNLENVEEEAADE